MSKNNKAEGLTGGDMVLSADSAHLRVAVSKASLECFEKTCRDLGYPRSVRLMLLRLILDLALESGADALRTARFVLEKGVGNAVRRRLKNLEKSS